MRVNCKNNGNYIDCCLQIKAKCFLDKVIYTNYIFECESQKNIKSYIFIFKLRILHVNWHSIFYINLFYTVRSIAKL